MFGPPRPVVSTLYNRQMGRPARALVLIFMTCSPFYPSSGDIDIADYNRQIGRPARVFVVIFIACSFLSQKLSLGIPTYSRQIGRPARVLTLIFMALSLPWVASVPIAR